MQTEKIQTINGTDPGTVGHPGRRAPRDDHAPGKSTV